MELETATLLELFRSKEVVYTLFEHQPVYTSDEASKVRNVELKTGVKAMLVRSKDGGKFLLADIAADRRIDFPKLESLAKARHLRFATREEVLAATKCESGSVHPLGRLFGIETFLDNSVLENEYVNFNIGMLTRSVKVRSKDLLRVLEPDLLADFSKM
ncbi:MAG TPA: YbaK/EbsC family protein [Nitrososphaerales archaeon]|nr:YbaK/EbsC family protein [Nitrososphaerales archaeon]